MFFWYLGAGSALLLVTLGPRRIDYRLALLGLVLPLADVVIRILAFPHSRLGVHLYLHTFLFALVLALVVMTFLRGATARRWFVVAMAVVIHLLLAGMLGDPVGLFWPLLGSHFARLPDGVSLIDGNYRMAAFEMVQSLTDAQFAQANLQRPSRDQEVWVGTHSDGEVARRRPRNCRRDERGKGR